MADLLAFLSGAADPLTNRGAVPFADPDVGRQLFRSKGCAKCHGQNAAGGLEGHPLLAPRQYRTVAEIAGAMWNHRFVLPEHPAEARLNQDEMLALIAYFNLPQTAP